MEKELLDLSAKRFDIFRTILGILMVFLAGYLWLKYFFGLEYDGSELIDFIFDNLKFAILTYTISFIFFVGIYFFIVGYTQMETNYNIEKTVMQVQAIKSLEELQKMDFDKFDIPQTTTTKLRKYIKTKLKELLESFE